MPKHRCAHLNTVLGSIYGERIWFTEVKQHKKAWIAMFEPARMAVVVMSLVFRVSMTFGRKTTAKPQLVLNDGLCGLILREVGM